MIGREATHDRSSYDAANRLTNIESGHGLAESRDEVAYGYTANGLVQTMADGLGNLTTYEYDGLDRLLKTRFPRKVGGGSSTSDYQQLSYDSASNVSARRLRDGTSIGYAYDHLHRLKAKDLPGAELDISYSYDNLGRLTSAVQSGHALMFGYDALSRLTAESGPRGTVGAQYDLAGRRTRLVWPDAFYVDYDYNLADEMTAIRENGATSGPGVLATFAYDDLGRRTSLGRGNGATTSYGYDLASRLSSLTQNLSGTASDVTLAFDHYSPAGQIGRRTMSNDLYAWSDTTESTAPTTALYTVNGQNQYTAVGTLAPSYDARGNLSGGVPGNSRSFGYSAENLLVGATPPSGPALSIAHDPLQRPYRLLSGSSSTRFAFDGANAIAEYDGSAVTLTHRYVYGPGADEVLVRYQGVGLTTRRWLHADERGSIIAESDDAGEGTQINRYDNYGTPAPTRTAPALCGTGRCKPASTPTASRTSSSAALPTPTAAASVQAEEGSGQLNQHKAETVISFPQRSSLKPR